MDNLFEMIAAMRKQESSAYMVKDWTTHQSEPSSRFSFRRPLHHEAVDMECREKIAAWTIQVIDFCKFNRETVEITLSLLDRYLTSKDGAKVCKDRSMYQLMSMAALYTAVKVHEPEAMDPNLVSNLSRGAYSASEIEEAERKLLSALQWRVNPPTAMAFVRLLLDLVPSNALDEETRFAVHDLAKFQIELTAGKPALFTTPASTVAYAALINAMESLYLHNNTVEFVTIILDSALNMDCKSPRVAGVQGVLYQAVIQQPVGKTLSRSPREAACTPNKATNRISPEVSPRSVSS